MVWTYDVDNIREDSKENETHKMERKQPRVRPITRQIDQFIKHIEKGGEGQMGKKYKKTGSGSIEVIKDFFVMVDPYLWQQLRMMTVGTNR